MPYCSQECASAAYALDSINANRELMASLDSKPAPERYAHRIDRKTNGSQNA